MINTKKLTACEKELRLVIDDLPNMIAYVDASKIYRIINRAYHDYFGASEKDIIGKHVSKVLGDAFYKIIDKEYRMYHD